MADSTLKRRTRFTFYWKDGTISTGYGICVSDAFTSAGYGNGAVPALDFYTYGMMQKSIYLISRNVFGFPLSRQKKVNIPTILRKTTKHS